MAPNDTEAAIGALGEQIGYRFTDLGLLRQAMAHRSWCAEQPDVPPSNERLEFLGDAVLGWVIADLVYRRHADLSEGRLTELRKSVVNAGALAEVARSIGLGDALLLGKGERAAGGGDKPSLLSDGLEATLGAVYIDGGAEAVVAIIDRLFSERLRVAAERVWGADFKTTLQELTARRGDAAPQYRAESSGPDHAKQFTAEVWISDVLLGTGVGRTKKAAEQAAAEAAYTVLADSSGYTGA
jgi:ribonuclease III